MSRLLESSDQYRNQLTARKLYTPEDPYDANASKTVNTINTIVNTLKPFSTFDLANSVLGRTFSNNNTPLAQIGLQMLGTQLGYNAASNAAAEYLPDINFSNLFDGNPNTKLITTKVDFQITRRETQSTVGKILEEVSGTYPNRGNAFPTARVGTLATDNKTFIENTGKGQLQTLLDNLSKNRYKPSSSNYKNGILSEGFEYGDLEKNDALNKIYFVGRNNVFNPYNRYKSAYDDAPSLNIELNSELRSGRTASKDNSLEYGYNDEFVEGLGKTAIKNNNDGDGNYIINPSDYGFDDNTNKKLIWGRDGTSSKYDESSGSFDRINEGVEPNDITGDEGDPVKDKLPYQDYYESDASSSFNLENAGLLSYTRELLNSKGRYANFDITRKKFIDENEQLHFNGSPLTKRLTGKTDRNRQHSVADPYNRFVKTIRYNGNKIYNGNQDSVIYNKVIPKITPELGDRGVDRKLMFSIENLAYEVTRPEENDTIVYSDDENRTVLPACEAGANGGRVMWFPPYDVNLTENVVVNRDVTNFVGRGEPIYTYSNTERLANLSFKLIIDYPPQVRGLNHLNASRFFAFGGFDASETFTDISEKEKRIKDLTKERDVVKNEKEKAPPEITTLKIPFHFANDEPKSGDESIIIATHISGNYEIDPSQPTTFGDDGKNFKLNENFVAELDQAILDYFLDVEKAKYTKIRFIGSASDLFLGESPDAYNLALSQRRILALKAYVSERYKTLIGDGRSIEKDNIVIEEETALGGQGGEATNDPEEIPSLEAKEARRADIEFTANQVVENSGKELTPDEGKTVEDLTNEISALETEISKQKNKLINVGCDFIPYFLEDGVLKGFESIEKNKYKPAFHSQTPEDFHRRLTFLQQCCRQGEAVRKQREDGTFSASNSVFGKQPVQVLRIGDFFHTKVVIDSMSIDYTDAPWDMNPEGMGMQFMIADVKLSLRIIGGQSLKTPINVLQNAISYNYYANSTFYNTGLYTTPSRIEADQINELRNENNNNTTNPEQNPNGNNTQARD